MSDSEVTTKSGGPLQFLPKLLKRIDEADLDVSSWAKNFNEAIELARRILQKVLDKEKLTCSVGVAPSILE